jgi:hypothetical protein
MPATGILIRVCLGALMALSASAQAAPDASAGHGGPARGPLRLHPQNPRYFTAGTKGPDGACQAVYLTGSHHWHNLQDAGKPGGPITEKFDYDGYLALRIKLNHNFMRMWGWEGGAWWYQGGENDEYYAPVAYSRAGSGKALDGKPKFDLNEFNPAYFERLRARVSAAGNKGIYVSVMLFQGWSIYNHGYGNPWPLHPFNKANNVNGIDGDPNKDGEGREVHSLQVPAVTRLQKAYARQVIDTLNDLDNVLYEITNETAIFSRDWQYHMVRYIKEYQATKPKQHPVGMTAFDSGREGSMRALLESPADWISPQNDGASGNYQNDPPAADGRKVILSDTDHLWGVGGDRVWVWKSFTRGHHPIYMDPLRKEDWFAVSEADMEAARQAMGQTRRVAERVNLAALTPRGALASSGYCLAEPGREYLIYLPKGGTVTVDLTAATGELHVEWIHPVEGTDIRAESVAGGDKRVLRAPFRGDAVVHLWTSVRPKATPAVERKQQ